VQTGFPVDGVGWGPVGVYSDNRDLDPARLELAAQKRKLFLVEIELGGLRLELERVDDPVVLGSFDEARQFVRVKCRFDLILLSSSGDRTESPSLEALDATPAGNRSLHAGVRGMTVRAHFEHELLAHGAGGELVPARATAHVGRNEVGVIPLHSNISSRHKVKLRVRGDAVTNGSGRPLRVSSPRQWLKRTNRVLHSSDDSAAALGAYAKHCWRKSGITC
jgi:hypothetical protein